MDKNDNEIYVEMYRFEDCGGYVVGLAPINLENGNLTSILFHDGNSERFGHSAETRFFAGHEYHYIISTCCI